MSVSGDVAVVGSADHGLIEFDLRGGTELRKRRTLYTKVHVLVMLVGLGGTIRDVLGQGGAG